MITPLQQNQIEEVLQRQYIGRIGCHADGITYVVPISYAYDGQYIYGHTYEGMKINIMRKNPRVCFEVDNTENMANWKSVIAWGDFEEVKEKIARNKALENLLSRKLPLNSSITTHLGVSWPFHPDDLNEINGIVFRIKLSEKTGRKEVAES